ncbi:MAG: hypothetical protein ACI8RD_001999, partial [Bacillariaceae sp.]|jgi:hypothetical protein
VREQDGDRIDFVLFFTVKGDDDAFTNIFILMLLERAA